MPDMCRTAGYAGQLSALSGMQTCLPAASRSAQFAEERCFAADDRWARPSITDCWWADVWSSPGWCCVTVLQDLREDNLPQVLLLKHSPQGRDSARRSPGRHFRGCIHQRKGSDLITVFNSVLRSIQAPTLLTLPYLWGGQALTPAQRWVHISSAQCASPNVTTRLQVTALKPYTAVKP